MTGRWWTRTAAAQRLGKTLDEIEALIATGHLTLHSIVGDHEVISEESIEEYERTHPKPALIPRDPSNPAEAEMTPTDDDLYRREKGT